MEACLGDILGEDFNTQQEPRRQPGAHDTPPGRGKGLESG